MSSSGKIIELRMILIGDHGVGKKSIVQRFKIINCTETIENDFRGFFPILKNQKISRKKEKSYKENSSSKTPKDKTKTKTNDEIDIDEIEEQKKFEYEEKKRIKCMQFSKIYRVGLNSLTINFYPCPEDESLQFDYELKDDEFYEFEKQNKITIRRQIKEIEKIIMKPPEDPNSQIKILFMLCYDLSNFSSFQKIELYFSQINRHFKLGQESKIILIGNKIDKKIEFTPKEKEEIDEFKSKYTTNYYEISTYLFFNFDNFLEKILVDNFGDINLVVDNKAAFHNIIHSNKTFTKEKRPQFGGDDNPGPNKYDTNPYCYPDDEKEFKKMFKDKDKYNKHIFINKKSFLYPPLHKNEKDIIKQIGKNKSKSTRNNDIVFWNNTRRDEVQAAIELQNNIPGYTLGIKNYKSLGLSCDRGKLRAERNKDILDSFERSNHLFIGKNSITEGNIELNQKNYENNRKFYREQMLSDKKSYENQIKERHDKQKDINMFNIKKKIQSIEKRQEKYTNIFKEMEKKREKNQKDSYKKNVIKTYTNYKEPKCRFYDPISSISTNKGFTFGRKYVFKDKNENYPDYVSFRDDFEKLIEKNKNRPTIKPNGPKIAETKSIEVGDSRIIMEKMKIFEERRLNHQKNIIRKYLEDRTNKSIKVKNKKLQIKIYQEQNLQEQIQKTYKTDENYLIRDINYTQVESKSPSFSMKGRYNNGSIFSSISNEYDNMAYEKIKSTLEYPDFSLIRPKYPAYSFGNSKRFMSLSCEKGNKVINIKNKNKDNGNNMNNNSIYYYGYQDGQSFLRTPTYMGTGKKLVIKDNGYPSPNKYVIRGFAEEVKMKGDKINETRVKLNEKRKLEDIEKQKMDKLREQRFEELKKSLKISLRDSLYKSKDINSNLEKTDNNLVKSEQDLKDIINENKDI